MPCPKRDENLVPGEYQLAAHQLVASGHTGGQLHRCLEPQQFVDDGGDKVWAGTQLTDQVRMIVHGNDGVADQVGGGLVACGQQQQQRRDDRLVGCQP
jgi:hypothetical protein